IPGRSISAGRAKIRSAAPSATATSTRSAPINTISGLSVGSDASTGLYNGGYGTASAILSDAEYAVVENKAVKTHKALTSRNKIIGHPSETKNTPSGDSVLVKND